MLRPIRMKKIQILALEDCRYEVVKRLQELGTVHLTDYSEKLADPELGDLLRPHHVSPHIRKIAAQNIAVNRLLDLFERHDPEPKQGFIKGVFAPLPPKRLETREIYGSELVELVDETIETIEGESEGAVKELERVEEEIGELERVRALLELLFPLEVDLGDIGESEFISVLLGISAREQVDTIRKRLEEVTDGNCCLGTWELSDKRVITLLICLKEHASPVVANLRRSGWERVELEGQRGRPREAMESVDNRLLALAEEKARHESVIVGIAGQWRDELQKYQEFLSAERQREESQNKFASMEHVVVIEGWIPEKRYPQAELGIREVTREACVVEASDPEEGDDVPVRLRNPKFFKSFELLTRLYGLPDYNGVDPTLFLVPGFLLFFSIMLTDALYGVIALALGFLLIRGGGRYNETIRDGGIILCAAGGATVIIGALSGGWFGGFGLKLPILEAMQVFDPMAQVTAFLLIALSVGAVHVNTGVVINVVDNLKRGQLWNALTGNLWFLFAQPAIVFYLLGYTSASLAFVTLSLALLLMGHKAMAMFQITGFMGDILSYARLMALGLCTTGIAMTVNVLAGMLYMLGTIGVLLAIVVFFVGHLFNFVINAMGSFVHGLRLHYVEFFTKFYRSGGSEFAPLKTNYEVAKIK
ncbi:MAG: V-type ATP synthase subunit I [Deltaproteobacteria bacterium]|nr:V-type ATP synthase subunit I [Deltaproteobacteria bacterium]